MISDSIVCSVRDDDDKIPIVCSVRDDDDK